ncbi:MULTISPECIES: PTS IIA-like nitrogen regulatory protein PtsN [Marinobacter]|uniref:PTS IIA-like nitrogen-regulatory protein PtsN n=1 Tax=Marinobacter profundi TaxID=2666256 RepID=A0A2G1UIT2_9GAMM|nr:MULTISPECIES: PTS IIA-like nitrogen regulatory protein PtsN [Marinobacter]MBD3655298.1 PTS IIA-like nitrogen regulatory protein PtsN [Marinobacter sp.]PHQ14394.1 PTS IIA-like nitrogen-regulatory protein PtsN [Marinobacter profundi]
MTDTTLTIENILAPDLALCRVQGTSKKRILEFIAEQVNRHDPALDETEIFNNLVSRERLGSTGIGQGIAIPHCRLEGCDHVVGVLITLEEGVAFDAIDNQPVDLLFALIVPKEATSEHLELLSQLAEKFNDRGFCDLLRQCTDADSLYQRMISAS